MGELDVRFHGICTHFNDEDGSPFRRVVLLQCKEPDPHHAMLSVPPSTKVAPIGNPDCKCIRKVEIDPPDGDVHYELHRVHLTMPDQVGALTPSMLWGCGIPRLSEMYPELGPISNAKARQEPPAADVAAWFTIRAGIPHPYMSGKGAVAVQLLGAFIGPIQIVASCWECPGTRWTFTFEDRAKVRVSNDCGAKGDPRDFLLHYQLAEHPPANPPTLKEPPGCTAPGPHAPFLNDSPPGWSRFSNESLGCSNSDYP
jgi:hypothetical protein